MFKVVKETDSYDSQRLFDKNEISLTFAAGSVVAEALLRFVGVVSGLMFRGGLIIRLLLLALILPKFYRKTNSHSKHKTQHNGI